MVRRKSFDVKKLAVKGDVEGLISALSDAQDWHARFDAAGALGAAGDARAVDALIRAMGDEAPFVRVASVGALAELGDARAVTALTGALRGEDARVRERAARALQLFDISPIDALVGALDDEDGLVRERATRTLEVRADERAVEALIAVLGDPEEPARKGAISALRAIGAPAVGLLVRALRDQNPRVRRLVVGALPVAGGREAVLPLIDALDDHDASVRRAAVRGLHSVGDVRAADALTRAAGDADATVRRVAAKTLRTLTGAAWATSAKGPHADVGSGPKGLSTRYPRCSEHRRSVAEFR